MMRKIFIIVCIFISVISAEEKHVSLIKLNYGISPDIRGGDYNHYNYLFGISFPVPGQQSLRFGFGFVQSSWTSYQLYKFEKDLLYDTQEVGKTDNLYRHLLMGFSTYISYTLNAGNHFWDQTSFNLGIFAGHPNTPNNYWLSDWGRITDRIVVCPFIRAERTLLVKYPWITGIVQMVYIHGAGIHTSFMFGCNLEVF